MHSAPDRFDKMTSKKQGLTLLIALLLGGETLGRFTKVLLQLSRKEADDCRGWFQDFIEEWLKFDERYACWITKNLHYLN